MTYNTFLLLFIYANSKEWSKYTYYMSFPIILMLRINQHGNEWPIDVIKKRYPLPMFILYWIREHFLRPCIIYLAFSFLTERDIEKRRNVFRPNVKQNVSLVNTCPYGSTHAHTASKRELDITKVQKDYSVLLRNSFTLQRDVFYVTCLLYFIFHNLISHTHF